MAFPIRGARGGNRPASGRPTSMLTSSAWGAFGATVPTDTLDVIDRTRDQVNLAKHEAEHFIGEADYKALVQAVMAFWEALTEHEEFTPPIRR